MNDSQRWIVPAVLAGAAGFGLFFWLGEPSARPKAESASASSGGKPADSRPSVKLPFSAPAERAAVDASASKTPAGSAYLERGEADLAALVRSDPEAAARSLENLPADRDRSAALRVVFREWAEFAPEAALKWADSMDSEEDRQAASDFVYGRVAEEDPKAAIGLAVQPGADAPPLVVAGLSQQWAMRDAAEAGSWALSLPQGETRNEVLSRVACVLAQTDPDSAGRIVAEELPAGRQQDEAAMAVLHQWAIRDLEGASEWVRQFPEGALRTRAERELRNIAETPPAGR